MDERVKRAMAQWPDVPDAYGWLSLDRRGGWRLQGERITNPALVAFIGRNYGATGDGGFAFQNGPQRVHVQLDIAPWIVHLAPSSAAQEPALIDHTGRLCDDLSAAWLDGDGQLWLQMNRGAAVLRDDALIHALDMIRGPSAKGWDEDLLSQPDQLDAADLRWRTTQGDIPLRALKTSPEEAFHFIRIPQAPS
nr:DUF2946 family protein [Oceanococcus sp. HetDA_MAG_MS8]